MIVDSDEGTREGEDLAEGDEDRVVYLAQGWAEEARREHRAPEDAQCQCGEELKILFHSFLVFSPTDLFISPCSQARRNLSKSHYSLCSPRSPKSIATAPRIGLPILVR